MQQYIDLLEINEYPCLFYFCPIMNGDDHDFCFSDSTKF